MKRPRLLDVYAGAGGASMGYSRAGFDVTGVDIEPQPHFPFAFIQADAIEYIRAHGYEYDAIAASPPCQRYSEMQKIHKNSASHPDLVAPTRAALIATGKPYVIENVEGAPLQTYFMLCGSNFGLAIVRHRFFESNIALPFLMSPCDHRGMFDPYHGGPGARIDERKRMAVAMGIDWIMTSHEVRNAIPPAYTAFIGAHLLEHLHA